jgi:hypothetical protein
MVLLGHWRLGKFRGVNFLYFVDGSFSLENLSHCVSYKERLSLCVFSIDV